jgi:uncharacterized protein (DUF885 family)
MTRFAPFARVLGRLAPIAVAIGAACAQPATPRIPPAPALPAAPPSGAPSAGEASARPPDAAFEALSDLFLEAYLRLQPVRATELGDHRFDDRWPGIGSEAERAERALLAQTREALSAIPSARLGSKNRVDRAILGNQLDRRQLALDELRPWENDPLHYTGLMGDGLDPLVTRSFAPPAVRAASLLGRLRGVPHLLFAARRSLRRPPRMHTETAIRQNDGLVALVEKLPVAELAKEPEQAAALVAAAAEAGRALRDFGQFLRTELLGRSDGDLRLGRARFDKKLRFDLDADVSAGALVADARVLLARTHQDMLATSLALWPELFPGRRRPEPTTRDERLRTVRVVLARLAEDHPTNATIVDEARRLLADATSFVRDKDLVRVPDEPIRVIEMPEYRRGVAIAYCDSSGPFEQTRETFFAISPTPADWPRERAESFYREYNRAMLADLTVHEAMPGHYLQLAHASRFASRVRAAFESGPFVEGWAVYAEWVMSRHGFGGLRTRLQREKMVLRMAANAILDHGIHAGAMNEGEAMRLMTEEAFQEQGEAAAKWRRACLTSAQLSTYFHGFSEMMKLRARAESLPGFRERAYHDRLLSFGAPAPRYLGHLLFGDPIAP